MRTYKGNKLDIDSRVELIRQQAKEMPSKAASVPVNEYIQYGGNSTAKEDKSMNTPQINLAKRMLNEQSQMRQYDSQKGLKPSGADQSPFVERFKLNDPRKIYAARLQPKLARGGDISPKATENVADIMYQMLCDEKTLNVKDVVQAKYGPEMLETIRNKDKAEFMAQTRSDLLLQVQADIASTIK